MHFLVHIYQDLSVSVSEVTVSWSSTAHRCVHRTIINLLEDINLIRGVSIIQCTTVCVYIVSMGYHFYNSYFDYSQVFWACSRPLPCSPLSQGRWLLLVMCWQIV